ncbi:RNA polymerase sigma factor (sigma-70 family) [Saccharothrix ecbatanensis]|uniref:RNA polymerase sigma factor (Sigma-70 family) n=1 Tax=Saccharothrix ecbatanensis TaxID=1105145 RepID=A0A7W9HJ58_9PSEU|nr:sigma-70 family RNA polymerase sigma factor [Saccharothrix ecbatanensis]MBB5802794.1 RNA polymerase sigma factor (sigma-70 family) [Saccharothrix ecbatanensis]
MIGHPDEHALDRWETADLAVLRDDLDHALHGESGEVPQQSRPPSDPELIEAVRGGEIQAYGLLYERHVTAARNLARHLSRSNAEADDLVSDAFAKVLDVLRAGLGPDSAFRAYLLTAVRHSAYDRTRRDKRLRLVDDVEAVSGVEKVTTVPFRDPAVETLERSLATMAFASLPERWQTVLWQTEIEGQTASELAPLLGLTANGASALAYRAREGLKTAYLQAHLARNQANRCRATVAKLGAWTRGGLNRREAAQVEAHLDECVDCRALAAELADVNGTLRAVIAPLVLGTGVTGYLAASAGAAKAGTAAGAGAAAHSVGPWLGVAASTTAVVVAVVWGLNSERQAVVPMPEALPPTVSVDSRSSDSPTFAATSEPSSVPTELSGATPLTTGEPANGPAEPVPPAESTAAAPTTTVEPVAEPLVPVVPHGFTMNTGGPPVDVPVTIRNTGRTPVASPTLVLSLPDGIRVVGPGNNVRGRALVGFDGAARQNIGCPAGQGTVTCAAGHELAAGGSVTFVFRLLAGPKAVGGAISGTVTAGSATPVTVEFTVAVTPKK